MDRGICRCHCRTRRPELECHVQGHERADRVPGLGRQAPHRHSQIFTVQPDGTHVRQLTRFHDSGAALPDWSPDGRKIIFTRYWGELGPPESFQLLTMNADGSAMRVTSRGLDERARYLPDGRILYRGGSKSWVVANPTLRTFETQRFTSAGPRCA